MDDAELPPPLFSSTDPLAGPGNEASADAFRRVLSRHRRHQAVVGSALVVIALVAGFLVGHQSSSGTQVAAGQRSNASSVAPRAAVAGAPSVGSRGMGGFATAIAGSSGAPSIPVVLRDATDGVRVRLYEAVMRTTAACSSSSGAATACPAAPVPSCGPTALLQAEVSDDQVAGETGTPIWTTPSATGLELEGTQVVGDGQPQPILVVLAHAGADVAQVLLKTAFGTDLDSPGPNGWVALAVQLPADYTPASVPSGSSPSGVVIAMSASHQMISSYPLWSPGAATPSTACVPPCEPPVAVPPAPVPGQLAPDTAPGSGPTTSLVSPKVLPGDQISCAVSSSGSGGGSGSGTTSVGGASSGSVSSSGPATVAP